jgi:hypothetical protein
MDSADLAKTDRDFAFEFFNDTWSFLDLKDRTKDQIEHMIHCSHAAFHHLERIPGAGSDVRARGYWQLSRVYAAAGQGVVARAYGFRCMDEAQAIGDPVLLSIACEALGRAAAVLGDGAERDRQAGQGKAYAALVLDPDSRAFCEGNIAAMPSSLEPGLTLPAF